MPTPPPAPAPGRPKQTCWGANRPADAGRIPCRPGDRRLSDSGFPGEGIRSLHVHAHVMDRNAETRSPVAWSGLTITDGTLRRCWRPARGAVAPHPCGMGAGMASADGGGVKRVTRGD